MAKRTRRKAARKKKTVRKKAERKTTSRKKTTRKKAARKTTSRKKTAKKKPARRKKRSVSRSVQGAKTAELTAELKRRQRELGKLERKRARAADHLAELDAEIAALGGGFSDGGRRRPRNETNLADALVDVLKGKEMGVSEAAEAVQAAGYRTSAANFRTIVNQTLIKDKRIKKVARGVYTAK